MFFLVVRRMNVVGKHEKKRIKSKNLNRRETNEQIWQNARHSGVYARFDNVGFGCGAVLCERGGGKRYKKLRTAGG